MADLSPAMLAQLAAILTGGQHGGATFGGNRFGGNTYGGNTFGGNKFGASAPQSVAVPSTPPTLPPFEQPGGTLPIAPYMAAAANPPPAAAGPAPPPAMPTAGVPVTEPVPIPPVDTPADVPPMPAPTPVADGSVRGDINAAIQQLIAQKKIAPNQLAEMFPQFAGGSLAQLAGGR